MLANNKNMYNIYHIPGKKIGVTRDLNKRVTEQQGYAPDEYEVLLTSDNIELVSRMEIELQKSYGYKVDRQSYKNLIKPKKMIINPSEQTSTFPYPLNKLKGNLMDNLGKKWETKHGTFELTTETIPWIMTNAKTSMYNDKRSFVYNKAFKNAFEDKQEVFRIPYDMFELIRQWAHVRGIYDGGNSHTQYVKLMEEAGELAQGLLKKDPAEIKDAIGDMIVVLTNLAALEGMQVEDCIESAYDEIKNRKGSMTNGTFVKSTL